MRKKRKKEIARKFAKRLLGIPEYEYHEGGVWNNSSTSFQNSCCMGGHTTIPYSSSFMNTFPVIYGTNYIVGQSVEPVEKKPKIFIDGILADD